jgi:hypothetical protein
VPKDEDEKVNNSIGKKLMIVDSSNYYNNDDIYSHKGENCHSKNTEELDIEHLKPDLKLKIKEEFKKHKEEQLILLKENKPNIIDFVLDNKESIRIEDLKIYEPVYKIYREKRNCIICNRLSNIICINCSNYSKEIRLFTNH